jgi:hypothetical protein
MRQLLSSMNAAEIGLGMFGISHVFTKSLNVARPTYALGYGRLRVSIGSDSDSR